MAGTPKRRTVVAMCADGGMVLGAVGAALASGRRSHADPAALPGAIDPTDFAGLPRSFPGVTRAVEVPTPSADEIGLAIHRGTIAGLRPDLGAADTRCSDLLVRREGGFAMHYAPLDPLSPAARVVLLAATPTTDIVSHALRAARSCLVEGMSDGEVMARAREAGLDPIRGRLGDLLDDLDLPRILSRESSAELIDSRVVDVTWAFRNPVSLDGTTYSGTNPRIGASDMLCSTVFVELAGELERTPRAPIVPLGDTAAEAVALLADTGVISQRRVLPCVPDPTTADIGRMARFREDKSGLERMRRRICNELGV